MEKTYVFEVEWEPVAHLSWNWNTWVLKTSNPGAAAKQLQEELEEEGYVVKNMVWFEMKEEE